MANVTQLLEASAMTLEHTDHKKALQSNPDIIRTDLPEKYWIDSHVFASLSLLACNFTPLFVENPQKNL
jgi:hypothetical protein